MTARLSASVLLVALGGAAAWAVSAQGEPIPRGLPATVYVTETVRVQSRSHGHSAGYWRWKNVQARVQRDRAILGLKQARLRIRRQTLEVRERWAPTLRSAVTLASAVTGVPAGDMLSVAYCESTWNPFAVNGRYRGYWQLGWDPFGLSPFDPYAAALSTAMTVRRDGGWSQWTCKPR